VELCLANLDGYPIEMRQVPYVAGGRTVSTGDQTGIVYECPPEMEALQRWQAGDFLQVEYQFASVWRRKLLRLTLERTAQWFAPIVGDRKITSLEAARNQAERLVNGERERLNILRLACTTQDAPAGLWTKLFQRWKDAGGPPLKDFAAYSAHVLEVDLFFYLAINAGLISADRPSNKIDMAYLYYLPFCMVFVSTDNLHKRTVPLFLQNGQRFVSGEELKADLANLDKYYSRLPAEVKEEGIMRFASDPPRGGEFLTTQLWDTFLPSWRRNAEEREPRSKETDSRLVDYITRLTEAPTVEQDTKRQNAEYGFMTLKHSVPLRMGKWRILPPEVEQGRKNRAERG
jgi:hypothetical protein